MTDEWAPVPGRIATPKTTRYRGQTFKAAAELERAVHAECELEFERRFGRPWRREGGGGIARTLANLVHADEQDAGHPRMKFVRRWGLHPSALLGGQWLTNREVAILSILAGVGGPTTWARAAARCLTVADVIRDEEASVAKYVSKLTKNG